MIMIDKYINTDQNVCLFINMLSCYYYINYKSSASYVGGQLYTTKGHKWIYLRDYCLLIMVSPSRLHTFHRSDKSLKCWQVFCDAFSFCKENYLIHGVMASCIQIHICPTLSSGSFSILVGWCMPTYCTQHELYWKCTKSSSRLHWIHQFSACNIYILIMKNNIIVWCLISFSLCAISCLILLLTMRLYMNEKSETFTRSNCMSTYNYLMATVSQEMTLFKRTSFESQLTVKINHKVVMPYLYLAHKYGQVCYRYNYIVIVFIYYHVAKSFEST